MAPREPAVRSEYNGAPDARATHMQLPIGAVTRSDVGSLSKEADAIDNFLAQAAIRQPGSALQLPKTSRLFDELVTINNLNLLRPADRKLLAQFLEVLRTKAPSIHISFNTDPSPLFLQRLVTWMRQQIHPFVLLRIGLHPSIGAGCVVRTNNKYYDFSMRQLFKDQSGLLLSKLRAGNAMAPPESTPTVRETAK